MMATIAINGIDGNPWPSMVAIIDGNGCHHAWQPVAIIVINEGNGPSSMAMVAIDDGIDGNPLPSTMATGRQSMMALMATHCHQWWQPIAIKDGNGCHHGWLSLPQGPEAVCLCACVLVCMCAYALVCLCACVPACLCACVFACLCACVLVC